MSVRREHWDWPPEPEDITASLHPRMLVPPPLHPRTSVHLRMSGPKNITLGSAPGLAPRPTCTQGHRWSLVQPPLHLRTSGRKNITKGRCSSTGSFPYSSAGLPAYRSASLITESPVLPMVSEFAAPVSATGLFLFLDCSFYWTVPATGLFLFLDCSCFWTVPVPATGLFLFLFLLLDCSCSCY
ncbi:hypothetical protein NFI96_013835 [Prochilodus magdalenae]|nr:hypothetical protein NFI96_013835 [Prochilodus magdalenae]